MNITWPAFVGVTSLGHRFGPLNSRPDFSKKDEKH